MATVATRQMKPEARAVLIAARDHYLKTAPYATALGVWFRPKAIGGGATNNCTRYLLALEKRGLIEKRDACQPGAWREKRIWEYRITAAGLEELRQTSTAEHRGGWYGSRCHGQ